MSSSDTGNLVFDCKGGFCEVISQLTNMYFRRTRRLGTFWASLIVLSAWASWTLTLAIGTPFANCCFGWLGINKLLYVLSTFCNNSEHLLRKSFEPTRWTSPSFASYKKQKERQEKTHKKYRQINKRTKKIWKRYLPLRALGKSQRSWLESVLIHVSEYHEPDLTWSFQ